MKMRLFVCIALATMVAGASAFSSGIALAQADPAKGQDENRQRPDDSSPDVDKALRSFDERMSKNLDKCRQDLDQMKKDLHELIDLRLSMAMSLAELRARGATPGGPFARPSADEGVTRGTAGVNTSEMARELQQLHNQLRAEVEQQQNQVAQLASQLRAMKAQARPAQQAGAARPDQSKQAPQGRGPEPEKAGRDNG